MRILLASPIDEEAVGKLREHHDVVDVIGASEEVLTKVIADRQALIFRSGVLIDGPLLARAPDLRLLVRAGSGLDNVDLDQVHERGLILASVPDPSAMAVAELAFALMLGLARQIRRADSELRQGHWVKHQLTGYLLRGKTLGVFGCGNIGTHVARMGAAWGMKVIACVRNASEQRKQEMARQEILLTDGDTVLSEADFLSIHVPLNDSTRTLIDGDALSKMRPGAFLVNLSRGGVVVEKALREALLDGRLAGAGMDVHAREGDGQVSPLADLSNVILTPHIGAGTVDTQRAIGHRVIEIIREFSGDSQGRNKPRSVAVRDARKAIAEIFRLRSRVTRD